MSIRKLDGDKGTEGGKNVFAKRYTRCDGEIKRGY